MPCTAKVISAAKNITVTEITQTAKTLLDFKIALNNINFSTI